MLKSSLLGSQPRTVIRRIIDSKWFANLVHHTLTVPFHKSKEPQREEVFWQSWHGAWIWVSCILPRRLMCAQWSGGMTPFLVGSPCELLATLAARGGLWGSPVDTKAALVRTWKQEKGFFNPRLKIGPWRSEIRAVSTGVGFCLMWRGSCQVQFPRENVVQDSRALPACFELLSWCSERAQKLVSRDT